jgi:excisionase family DNA binding protein
MTLAELLAPFGVTDDEYLAELASALHSTPVAGSAGLSTRERSVLDRFSGVTVPEGWATADTGRAWVKSSTENLANAVRASLSVEEAATLLGVSPSRVRHRVSERSLYGFKTGNRLRLPAWQFDESSPLPGLRTVLAAFPEELHPLEIAGFMDNPASELDVDDRSLPPRAWLISGGDPAVVADLVSGLGTIW